MYEPAKKKTLNSNVDLNYFQFLHDFMVQYFSESFWNLSTRESGVYQKFSCSGKAVSS